MASELVVLEADGITVRLPGGLGNEKDTGLFLAEDGVEGWYSTPTPKVSLVERGQGDGAHDITSDDVLYSARTVITHFVVNSWTDRRVIVAAFHELLRLAGRLVRMTFSDGGVSSYVEGYLSVENSDTAFSAEWNGDNTFTLVCPRPERLSTAAQHYELFPVAATGGGLWFGSDNRGLALPVMFGEHETSAMNRCTVSNDGSWRAYPTFSVNGSYPNGVTLLFDGDLTLRYAQPVWSGVPLVLDSRSRTASINGVDVSQHLTSRGFPSVPAGGALNCTLSSLGDGWVSVDSRDTWM